MYADNNEKAIAFGESHLKQLAGRVRSIRADYEKMSANGVSLMGGWGHQTGLSLNERRESRLAEKEKELDAMETKVKLLTKAIGELKDLEEPNDMAEDFVRNMRSAIREDIARLTGDNPRSYAEDR